jgi:hypothetical protein
MSISMPKPYCNISPRWYCIPSRTGTT